ncbi:MAG: SPFH domain-containing protein [Bacilli bacterium]|nr:SPFH domain-containing protein [Bacilli bacterium]
MLFILIGIIATIVLFFALGIRPSDKDHYDPYFKFRPLCLASIVALLLFTGLGAIKSVPTGHTGVVTTFGKVEDYTLEAGIHFINPISNVIKIDNRTQKETVEFSAFSSDIQEVEVVYTLNYSIDRLMRRNFIRL